MTLCASRKTTRRTIQFSIDGEAPGNSCGSGPLLKDCAGEDAQDRQVAGTKMIGLTDRDNGAEGRSLRRGEVGWRLSRLPGWVGNAQRRQRPSNCARCASAAAFARFRIAFTSLWLAGAVDDADVAGSVGADIAVPRHYKLTPSPAAFVQMPARLPKFQPLFESELPLDAAQLGVNSQSGVCLSERVFHGFHGGYAGLMLVCDRREGRSTGT